MARRSNYTTWVLLAGAAGAAYYFREKLIPLLEKIKEKIAQK